MMSVIFVFLCQLLACYSFSLLSLRSGILSSEDVARDVTKNDLASVRPTEVIYL